jgi:cytochrome c(L)
MRRRPLVLLAAGSLLAASSLGPAAVAVAEDQPAKKLNKYTGKPDAIKEGRALFMKYGCSGCHGVGGGGGMGPPLVDDVWKFGSSDETLYKLVKGQIPNQTMPKVLGAQMSDDEIWKVLAFVRSIYAGDPSKVNW